jgi:hypothetical protein
MDMDLQFDILNYRGEGMETYLIERREKLDGICEEISRSLSTQTVFVSLCCTLNSRDADTLERAIQSKEAMLSWETARQGRKGCPHLVELLQSRPMQKLPVIVEETDDKTEVDDGDEMTGSNDETGIDKTDDEMDNDSILSQTDGQEWSSSSTCDEGELVQLAVPPSPPKSKNLLGSSWVNGCRRSTRFQQKRGSIIVNGLRRSARLM